MQCMQCGKESAHNNLQRFISANTRIKSRTLVSGCVDNVLFIVVLNVHQARLQVVDASNLLLADTLLHCSLALLTHRINIRIVWWREIDQLNPLISGINGR